MTHTRVFTLEGSSVAGGGTESLTDSDNESWVIKKVQVEEEGNNALSGSTATISIQGNQVTDQNVPVELLRDDFEALPELDLEWPSNTQFEFDWTNGTGATSFTINVSLWVEPMQGGG